MSELKLNIKDFLDAGIHIGHSRRSRNHELKPFISGSKNNTLIIDITKSVKGLENVADRIMNIVKKNENILFVLTDAASKRNKEAVEKLARETGQYWMTHRWPGGTLTNIKTIRSTLKSLSAKEAALNDADSKYTKKEKLSIQREIKKTKKIFEGIIGIKKIPSLLFVFNTVVDKVAIKEANSVGIPVAAIVDTNGSITGVDYPIPGNDDSIKTIELVGSIIRNAIEQAKTFGSGSSEEKTETKIEVQKTSETQEQASEQE